VRDAVCLFLQDEYFCFLHRLRLFVKRDAVDFGRCKEIMGKWSGEYRVFESQVPHFEPECRVSVAECRGSGSLGSITESLPVHEGMVPRPQVTM
jgi:hypothetical protein